MGVCSYEKPKNNFKCDRTAHNGTAYCLFHDKNYLHGDNYELHKNEVASELKSKISGHLAKTKLDFIGYCLPQISFGKSNPFNVEVSFEDAIFYGPAYFDDIIFYEAVSLEGATFTQRAHFFRAKFCKNANFKKAKFTDKAYFNEAKFSNDATFEQALFSDDTYFSVPSIPPCGHTGTTFCGKVNFKETMFCKSSNFHTATFCKEACFFRTIFSGIVYFFMAKFCQEANFNESRFIDKADFRTTYFWRATFRYTKFLSEVYFMDVIFKRETLFNYTIFEQPNEVLFSLRDKESNTKLTGASADISEEKWFTTNIVEDFDLLELDMSNVSFANTDITKIRFGDKIRWSSNKKDKYKYKVYDEEWFLNGPMKFQQKSLTVNKKLNCGNNISNDGKCEFELPTVITYDSPGMGTVISVYRNLRENYEFRLRFDEAGEFFKREMELKRKYRYVDPERKERKENNFPRADFSLTGVYYHLSRYGESISRPILVGTIIIALSTLFFLLQDTPPSEPFIACCYFTTDKQFIATAQAHNFNVINHTWYNVINHIWNNTLALKAFERSLVGFVPLLSMNNEPIQVLLILSLR